jgi:S-formylglutathione hydrolase FrmB
MGCGFAGLRLVSLVLALGCSKVAATACATADSPLAFRLSFDPNLQPRPFTGRVYVILANPLSDEPRREINSWFRPPRILARDVRDWPPEETIVLDDGALSFPAPLIAVPPGEYRIQAVARRSLDHPVPGQGPGDLYSASASMNLDPNQGGAIDFRLDRVVAEEFFEETGGVKWIELESPSLSQFHGRPMRIRAAVVLPAGWTQDSTRKYPVLYMIPGFGGDHRMAVGIARRRDAESPGHHVLFVVPDPTCRRGHSVFADSDNNGPWGRALVEELVPYVEKRFHGQGSPSHRYVTGVSSGGWSALWLQVRYPNDFNGCWAHCPDPVDFRDFQRTDVYAPGANMYVDAAGRKRPLARFGDRIVLYYEDFVRHEDILGPGGQIHSFEAVFGRRLENREPEPLFDHATGLINPEAARAWERYDIRLHLERNWPALEAPLRGKLHVYAGEKDTFFLEGAVALLRDSLRNLGSDAEVVTVPNMAHGLYGAAIEPMYKTILENFAKASEKREALPAGAGGS